MENQISQQALVLLISFSVGIAAALLYDLLRAVRIRRKHNKWLTHLFDGIYVLSVLFLALWLTLVIGQGRLQLYMLCGAGCGGLLWWIFPSRFLRKNWDFWMDAAVAFVRLLLRPLGWCKKIGKRVFSFFAKWITIQRNTMETEDPAVKKETTQRKKRKANPLILLVIGVLIVVVGLQIVKVYYKLSVAKEDEGIIEQQLADQQAENDALRSALEKANDEEFIKSLARDLLGLAEDGERIFYDVND